jgi:hypothetical protein
MFNGNGVAGSRVLGFTSSQVYKFTRHSGSRVYKFTGLKVHRFSQVPFWGSGLAKKNGGYFTISTGFTREDFHEEYAAEMMTIENEMILMARNHNILKSTR